MVPLASTLVSLSVAPPALGLGIVTVAMVQGLDVAALSSVQHNHRGSHLASASASIGTRIGMAAFQDIDYDESTGGMSKHFHLEESSSSSWYQKSDPETYLFDVECHRGPDSFFLFSILLVLPCSNCLWAVSVFARPSGLIQVVSGTGYVRT
jgi:hypothetical protein